MNERIKKFRAERRIAAAKARIEARELDQRCPDCERFYYKCRCVRTS